MKFKGFKIDQKVTFITRDHQKKAFITGEGTIEKILKDCYGHQFAEIREEIEVDGDIRVKSHVVPVAGLDLNETKTAKFERCMLKYEAADEKYRQQERERFEKLIDSIFDDRAKGLIDTFKKRQAKRVIEFNRILATLRSFAYGTPARKTGLFPTEVVEAAIEGEIKQVINDKVDDELNK